MNKLMTQGQFAAHRGVKPSAVSNWKKAGHLIWAEGEDGRSYIDVARTDARLNARIDQTRGRPSSGQPRLELDGPRDDAPPAPGRGGGNQLAEVRTDLMREQRIGQRLKNAREAGELVPLSAYERRAAEFARMSRERMHSAVRSLAERLAAAKEPREVTLLLTAEIDRAFAELADQVAAGALAASGDELDDGGEDAEATPWPSTTPTLAS